MKNCENCGSILDPQETYVHAGKVLCEDCFLDQKMKPVTCDPWAVYSAKRTIGTAPQLTESQFRILNLLKTEGPLDASEICSRLGITELEFQNCFATLRHMEVARGFRDGGKIRYTVC
ncbi:MAG: hypothetical protein ACP5SH_18530 [Syntrophobacteraceae bacterium]